MRLSLSGIHSLMAGYADTVGFLALTGLFTSHVTGNFVTLSSALVFGSNGALAKLLALPTFCVTVLLVKFISLRLKKIGWPILRSLLQLELALLIVTAVIAVWAGPFDNPDTGATVSLGMVLVAAMAVQNAAHRLFLTHTPPSTVMTVTTTQIMLDLGDMIFGLNTKNADVIRTRVKAMTTSVVLFAAGCALGALLFAGISKWCFCVLPVLAVFTLRIRSEVIDPPGS